MDMSYTIKVMAFCDIFACFGQNLVAMETSLRPLQSQMSSLDWSTPKTPAISNHFLAISRRNAFICIYSNFSPKIALLENFLVDKRKSSGSKVAGTFTHGSLN